jgi:D-arginine utilization repressor
MAKLPQAALDAKFGSYYAIAEAIVTLLHPHAEIAIHDIQSGRIAKIFNSFSARKIGDLSHLEGAPDLFGDGPILGPYEKALATGGRSKSITTALYDDRGMNIGFFCINMDVSMIDRAAEMLALFASPQIKRPEPIYRNDLQEHINYLVRDYLLTVNKTVNRLDKDEKLAFIMLVDANGLFQARNSVLLVAKALDISRASVYNLLAAAKTTKPVLEAKPNPRKV